MFNFFLYHSVRHPEVDYDHVGILLAIDLVLVESLFLILSKVILKVLVLPK